MAIKTSGSLSMTEIVAEFGGSAPHSLSEYYGAAAGVPSSGAIAFNNFYGKSAIIALTLPSGNFRRINLADWVVSQGYAANQAFQITVPSNTSYWSDSTSLPAVDASGLGALHLINNGKILGKGGDGYSAPADGVFISNNANRTATGLQMSGETTATDGGPALSMCTGTVTNNGYIAGGGGGGANSKAFSTSSVFSIFVTNHMLLSGTSGFGQSSTWYNTFTGPFAYNPLDVKPAEVNSWPSFATNQWWSQFTATAQSGDPIPHENGGGGGAGGGQGGRSSMTDSLTIGGVTGTSTTLPTVPTAIGQTGTATFRRGGTLDNYNVESVGLNTEQPPAPADGGGANGTRHRSSDTNLGGGETW